MKSPVRLALLLPLGLFSLLVACGGRDEQAPSPASAAPAQAGPADSAPATSPPPPGYQITSPQDAASPPVTPEQAQAVREADAVRERIQARRAKMRADAAAADAKSK